MFWIEIHWTSEIKMNFKMSRYKKEKGSTTWRRQGYDMGMYGLLMFIEDVTADRSREMNFVECVQCYTLSSHLAKCYKVAQMDNVPNHTAISHPTTTRLKQPLHSRMAHHRRANSSDQDSTVH